MIGYRPHPSLLGGNGGGSGGSGVDQTARDAVAASDAVNATQATEIGALKAADTAFETRAAVGEAKDGTQDMAISGLQTADTALAGRATALEGRATSGETKDAAQDADLVAHAGRLTAGETKDTAQDADLVALHGADTTLAGRATALEGRATTGESKDVAQDADLAAHGTRLTASEAKNTAQDTDLVSLHTADTALAGRATALEGRATSGESKDAAQDTDLASLHSADTALGNRATTLEGKATANETKDANQDSRISANESNIANIQTQVTGLANLKGTVFLGKYRIKAADAKSGFDIASVAPAGTVEFDVVLGGGGASGVAASYGTGSNANSGHALAHGGFPGQVRRSGRVAYSAGMKLDMLIGSGGAAASITASSSNAGLIAQNAGSATTVTIRKADGSVVSTARAPGGRHYNDTGSVLYNGTAIALVMALLSSPIGGVPGQGNAGSSSRYVMEGSEVIDGPGGGAGSPSSNATSAIRGKGGRVRYSRRPEAPALDVVEGGETTNATGGNASPTPTTSGANPAPLEAGTFGSGGGAGYASTEAGREIAGGAGGYPCGGGGGCLAGVYAATAVSGAGGDGFVDIFFYGVPPQSGS